MITNTDQPDLVKLMIKNFKRADNIKEAAFIFYKNLKEFTLKDYIMFIYTDQVSLLAVIHMPYFKAKVKEVFYN